MPETPQRPKKSLRPDQGTSQKSAKRRRSKEGTDHHFNYLWLLAPLAAMGLAIWEIQHAIPSWKFWHDQILHKTWIADITGLERNFYALDNFPQVYPVVIAIIIVWVYRPEWRRSILPFAIAMGVAGAAVGAIKEVAGRARPNISAYMEREQRFVERMGEHVARYPNSGLKTVSGDYWLGVPFPNVLDRPWGRGDFASFPSGHAASAFVFAFWLGLIFGKLKWLWYLVAIGTCLARIRLRRHYPGDVLFGAALGWLIVYLIFYHPYSMRFGGWFRRSCARIARKLRLGMLVALPAKFGVTSGERLWLKKRSPALEAENQ